MCSGGQSRDFIANAMHRANEKVESSTAKDRKRQAVKKSFDYAFLSHPLDCNRIGTNLELDAPW